MSDLRRRLSFGEPPDFPVTGGGLAAVATGAVRRRRACAAVTSLTAVALVAAFAVAGGAGPGGTAGLHPTATHSPDGTGVAPTPSPTTGDGTSETPGPLSPSPVASGPRVPPSGYEKTPPPEQTDSPAPEETSEPSETPAPTPDPTSAPPPDGVEQWSETVETVDDRPQLGCYRPAEEKGGWCWRWSGARSFPARQPVAFEFELCRRAPGTEGDRIDLDNDVELDVMVDYEQDARSADRRVPQPHSRAVPLGKCLRWTATWNGIAEDGYWARPATYGVRIRVLGVMPYTDATGRQTRHGYPSDWGRIDLT